MDKDKQIAALQQAVRRAEARHAKLQDLYMKALRGFPALVLSESRKNELAEENDRLRDLLDALNVKCAEVIAQNIEHKKVLSTFDILTEV